MRSSRTLYLLAVLAALAGLWSYRTPIDRSVGSRGIVRPLGDPIRVISEIGGRIKKIDAVEGATVSAGAPLVQLDTSGLLLKRRSIEKRIHFAEARRAGLDHRLTLYHELEQTNIELTRLTITAPAGGAITSVAPIHEGEILSSGAAIATLIPASHELVIESWLPIPDRPYLSAGQRVRLQTDAFAPGDYNALDGTVLSISSDARFNESLNGAYRVLIAPAPYTPALRPGMTFNVHFITQQEPLLRLVLNKMRLADLFVD